MLCVATDPYDATVSGDCDDARASVRGAADSTCDGDTDGFIDISAYNNGQPDGDFGGFDLDDTVFHSSAGQSGTVLYMTTASHNGDFDEGSGGEAGLRSWCEDNKPVGLVATSVRPFVGVDSDREIRDMPTRFSFNADSPLYWYHRDDRKLRKLADDWADMLDGTIETDVRTGTGQDSVFWTGSRNDGIIPDVEGRYACTEWTATFCEARWNFNHSINGNHGSGAVSLPNRLEDWLYGNSTTAEKLAYGPAQCAYYEAFACNTTCPPSDYSHAEYLECAGSAHVLCAATP